MAWPIYTENSVFEAILYKASVKAMNIFFGENWLKVGSRPQPVCGASQLGGKFHAYRLEYVRGFYGQGNFGPLMKRQLRFSDGKKSAVYV